MHLRLRENADFKEKDLCELVFSPIKNWNPVVSKEVCQTQSKLIFLAMGHY